MCSNNLDDSYALLGIRILAEDSVNYIKLKRSTTQKRNNAEKHRTSVNQIIAVFLEPKYLSHFNLKICLDQNPK